MTLVMVTPRSCSFCRSKRAFHAKYPATAVAMKPQRLATTRSTLLERAPHQFPKRCTAVSVSSRKYKKYKHSFTAEEDGGKSGKRNRSACHTIAVTAAAAALAAAVPVTAPALVIVIIA